MQIFLMRHAEAVSPNDWAGSDQDRPLSAIGIAKFDAGLREMKRAKFGPFPVLSSPYIRAKTTAELLTNALGWKKPLVDPRLAAGAYAEAIRQTAVERSEQAALLIVGHMPELAVFASRVTLEPRLLDTGLLPADIVAIEVKEPHEWGTGKMLWWRTLNDWKKVKE